MKYINKKRRHKLSKWLKSHSTYSSYLTASSMTSCGVPYDQWTEEKFHSLGLQMRLHDMLAAGVNCNINFPLQSLLEKQ